MTEVESASHHTPYNGWKILLAIIFLLLLGAVGFGYWHLYMRGIVSTDDARLDGDLIDLAPQINGKLVEVSVREGDRVHKGQVLFRLEKNSEAAVLAKAEAAVCSAQAALAVAEAQYKKSLKGPRLDEIRIAEVMKHQADAAAKLAEAEWSRVKALHNDRVVTESSRDKVRTAYEAARYAQDKARLNLKLLRQGARAEDIAAAKANVELRKAQLDSAKAALQLARINLDRTVVCAPFDGIVVRQWRNPGAIVTVSRPILTIFDPTSLHVSANIEEKYLSRIAVGDRVDISVDAYPHLNLTGRVQKIMRATNSKFSLIPSEGASGTYIKVAQRVPIRIDIDSYPDLPLGPGLSVGIRIHVSQKNMISGAVAAHNE